LASIYVGGIAFEAVVIACALISSREWARMTGGAGRVALACLFAGIILTYVVVLLMGAAAAAGTVAAVTVVTLILCKLAALPNPVAVAAGVPYLGFPLIALVLLRDDPVHGLSLLLFLVLVIWANDIAAYAVGRAVKGPKLAPRISPNKTWSGSIGGVVFGAGVASAAAAVLSLGHPATMAVIGSVLGIAGQIGDLFESFVKRRFKVKDSGGLIPGHGGMLDRVDSILTGAVFLGLVHLSYREWLG
jgi:phosphatidate cytidylyltransferase